MPGVIAPGIAQVLIHGENRDGGGGECDTEALFAVAKIALVGNALGDIHEYAHGPERFSRVIQQGGGVAVQNHFTPVGKCDGAFEIFHGFPGMERSKDRNSPCRPLAAVVNFFYYF